MPWSGCVEHELENVMFYVQEYIAHFASCSAHLLNCDRPLGAPTFVKLINHLSIPKLSIHNSQSHISGNSVRSSCSRQSLVSRHSNQSICSIKLNSEWMVVAIAELPALKVGQEFIEMEANQQAELEKLQMSKDCKCSISSYFRSRIRWKH